MVPAGWALCVPVTTVALRMKRSQTLLQADKLYLYEKFAPLGAVLSVRVLTDETGNCRGVGFVNYADPRAASQARLSTASRAGT